MGAFAAIFTLIFAAPSVPGFVAVFPKTAALVAIGAAVAAGIVGFDRGLAFVRSRRAGLELAEPKDERLRPSRDWSLD